MFITAEDVKDAIAMQKQELNQHSEQLEKFKKDKVFNDVLRIYSQHVKDIDSASSDIIYAWGPISSTYEVLMRRFHTLSERENIANQPIAEKPVVQIEGYSSPLRQKKEPETNMLKSAVKTTPETMSDKVPRNRNIVRIS